MNQSNRISKVFLGDAFHVGPNNSLVHKIKKVWQKAELDNWIERGDRVLIKSHFGSVGATQVLRPIYHRELVDLVKGYGGFPVVAETCGLGLRGGSAFEGRGTLPDYLYAAIKNGHSPGTLGAPVVMIDGYFGTETIDVPVTGKHLTQVHMAAGLVDFNKIIIASRFKGHAGMAFGGALKQLGIGCVGKQGKARVHWGDNGNLFVKNPENCTQCGKCLKFCPKRCLTLEQGEIQLNEDHCIMCGHCYSVCRPDNDPNKRVFGLRKKIPRNEQVERMMDNVKGLINAIGATNIVYLNIAIDIGVTCDCAPYALPSIVPDQGILLSEDPLAIDKACFDLVNKATGSPGSPLERGFPLEGAPAAAPELMGAGKIKLGPMSTLIEENLRPFLAQTQLEYAAAVGIGNLEYELISIDHNQ